MGTKKQITNNIMMVRPAHFGYNAETATNNAFQTNDNSLTTNEIQDRAKKEFDTLVQKLRAKNVNIIVIEDSDTPFKSDAVFPNNWVSFHEDGRVFTYPMFSPIRREERREEILQQVAENFKITDRIQMEGHEAENLFLEGTGSMLFDRPNQLVYACLSLRTDEGLLDEFCQKSGFKKIAFTAVDGNGVAIYHTNVMMALGENFAVICLESIPNEAEKQEVLKNLAATGKTVIDISLFQMNNFAGNMLQVQNGENSSLLVMSDAAFNSLTKEQISEIEKYTEILHSGIPTIENYGGGSVRCMMAEVFLQKK